MVFTGHRWSWYRLLETATAHCVSALISSPLASFFGHFLVTISLAPVQKDDASVLNPSYNEQNTRPIWTTEKILRFWEQPLWHQIPSLTKEIQSELLQFLTTTLHNTLSWPLCVSLLNCYWSVLASPHELSPWLFSRFLTYCPSKRIVSDEALKHEYFRETPLPIDPSMFPTWPAKSEQQRVKRGTSPRPPEGGLGYSHLVRTSGSTFSITHSYQAFWMLSVLNRLQTYRLLLCVRVFPPCVFHDEHPLDLNVFSSGPTHPEVVFLKADADIYIYIYVDIYVCICIYIFL